METCIGCLLSNSRSGVAPIDAIVKIADHLDGDPPAVLQRPAGALITITFLQCHFQDCLVGAAMFFVEIGFFMDAKILHVFGREAVLRQALTKILRDKAEYFLLHVDGVTLRERNVDPGTDEKVH